MRSSSERLVPAALLVLAVVACGKEFSAAPPSRDSPDASTPGAGGRSAEDASASAGTSGASAGGAAAGAGGKGTPDAGAGGAGSSRDAAADAAPPPPDIPTDGLVLWLRADLGVTQGTAGVAVWADQSPLHANAVQTTPNLRPRLVAHGISSRPSMAFDGVDDYFRLPPGFADFEAGLTILTVAQIDVPQDYTAVFEASNAPEVADISLGVTRDQINYEVFDGSFAGMNFSFGEPQLFGAVHRPSTFLQIRRNGSSEREDTTPLPENVVRQENFIGRSLYADAQTLSGLVSEVILYNRALTDEEVLGVEETLTARWACCTR